MEAGCRKEEGGPLLIPKRIITIINNHQIAMKSLILVMLIMCLIISRESTSSFRSVSPLQKLSFPSMS